MAIFYLFIIIKEYLFIKNITTGSTLARVVVQGIYLYFINYSSIYLRGTAYQGSVIVKYDRVSSVECRDSFLKNDHAQNK